MSMWKKLKKEKRATGKAGTLQTFDLKTGQRIVGGGSSSGDPSEGTFDPKTGQRLDGSGNPIVIADSSKGSNIDLRNSSKENKGAKKIEYRKSKIEMVSPVERKPLAEESDFQDSPIRKARVLYGYTPEQEDEITLVPGKIIMVYEEDDSGWWTGECEGKYGLFPGGFVELIEEEPSPPQHKDSPRVKTAQNNSNNAYNDMMDMMEDEEFRRMMLGEEEKEDKKKKEDKKEHKEEKKDENKEEKKKEPPLTSSLSSNSSTPLGTSISSSTPSASHTTSAESDDRIHKLTIHLEQLQSDRKTFEHSCLQIRKDLQDKSDHLTELNKATEKNQHHLQELSSQIAQSATPVVQPRPSPSGPAPDWESLKNQLLEENQKKKEKRDELFNEFQSLQETMTKGSQEKPELDNLLEEAKKKAEEIETRVTRMKVFEENNVKLKVDNEKLRKKIIDIESETDDKMKELWTQNKESRNKIRELKATIEYDSPELEALEEANRKLTLEVDGLKTAKAQVPDPVVLNNQYKDLRAVAEQLRKKIRDPASASTGSEKEVILRQQIKDLETQLLELKANFDTAVEKTVEHQANRSTESEETKEKSSALDENLAHELSQLRTRLASERQAREETERKLQAVQEANRQRPSRPLPPAKPVPPRPGTSDPSAVVNKLGQKPILRPRKPDARPSDGPSSASMSFQQKLQWFERLAKEPSDVSERRRSIEFKPQKVSSISANPTVELPKINKKELRRVQSWSPQDLAICTNRKKEYQDVKEDVENKFAVPVEGISSPTDRSVTPRTEELSPTISSGSVSSFNISVDGDVSERQPSNPRLPATIAPTTNSGSDGAVGGASTDKPLRPAVPPRPPGGLSSKRTLWARSVLMSKE